MIMIYQPNVLVALAAIEHQNLLAALLYQYGKTKHRGILRAFYPVKLHCKMT